MIFSGRGGHGGGGYRGRSFGRGGGGYGGGGKNYKCFESLQQQKIIISFYYRWLWWR